MSQLTTAFPDSSYTSSNKPSVATLKSDISAIETAHNDLETNAIKLDTADVSAADFVIDEDNMASNSAVKVPVQQSVKAYVDAQITATKAAIYPIGSIYTAIVSTNPATLLGFGTWSAFGAGRVIVGHNASDADFDTAEETGGAKTVSVAHTHAGPSHTHTGTTGQPSGQNTCEDGSNDGKPTTTHTHTFTTDAGGTGNTGAMSANATPSIVQPYIVAYVWKRTA